MTISMRKRFIWRIVNLKQWGYLCCSYQISCRLLIRNLLSIGKALCKGIIWIIETTRLKNNCPGIMRLVHCQRITTIIKLKSIILTVTCSTIWSVALEGHKAIVMKKLMTIWLSKWNTKEKSDLRICLIPMRKASRTWLRRR